MRVILKRVFNQSAITMIEYGLIVLAANIALFVGIKGLVLLP